MASNFFNKASLVMVPDAPIDGKLPSVKPEDRSGDFTFSRGSNLAATRVNKDGLIEKGRENLLLQSNTFSSWGTVGVNWLGGQSGYDSSNDAWILTDTATSGDHRLYIANSHSGVNTLSVYAKAGTKSIVYVQSYISNSSIAYFDLSAGSILSTASDIDSKIESVGNGWYRCSIAFNNTNSYVTIGMAESATRGYSGDGTGTIYIQDAQLEKGLVATGYIETTTAAVQKGILENLPRLDYSGGASCPSLLLEPQRSQLITQSEYFGSATWNKQNSIGVNTNSHLSPEGIQNATELDGFDSSNFQSVAQYITLSAGTYTFSVFLKKTTGALNHYPAVVMGSVYKYVIVNSTTGTYAESTGTNNNDSVTIESWDDNWWRVSLTNTLSAGAQRFAIYPALSANGTFITTNASGTNVFWGAQVEVGSYPTSYIPAYGSSVTRSGDTCSDAGDATTFNDSEGVLYAEIAALADDGTFRNISVNNGTTAQSVRIYYRNTANKITALIGSSSGGGVTVNVANLYTFNKIALVYQNDNAKLFVNGILEGTIQGITMPTGLNQLDFNIAGVLPFYGKAKEVIYFPTALTDDECIALTTI